MQTSAASDGGNAGFAAPDVPSDAIVNTCIKCGFCLPTCPTYELTLDERSSPRGRIHLIQAVLEGELPVTDPTFRAQMFECLGCRNCEPVCPSGVRFGALLEDARAQIARTNKATIRTIVERLLYDALLGNLALLRALSAVVAFAELSGLRAFVRQSGVLDAAGMTRIDSLLPAPRGRPFVARGQAWRGVERQARGTAALFTGCIASAMFGDTHRATVRVLSRDGWRVEVPPNQGCCGALHLHAGFKDGARGYAKRTIAAFEESHADAIAVNAAGCGAAMKEYASLLCDEPEWAERAARFSARVRDATELVDGDDHPTPCGNDDDVAVELARHDVAVELARPKTSAHIRVAYQDACHLAHAQRIVAQPRRLIDTTQGVERVEIAESDRCCGSAGVYNLTHPEMADALADRKIAAAMDAGAQRIVTANLGCQMQLDAAARRAGGPPVQHIMEFLDDPFANPRPRVDRRHAAAGGLLLAAGAIVLAGIAFYFVCRKR